MDYLRLATIREVLSGSSNRDAEYATVHVSDAFLRGYNGAHGWRFSLARNSGPTKFNPHLVRVAWERCIAPATPGWSEM